MEDRMVRMEGRGGTGRHIKTTTSALKMGEGESGNATVVPVRWGVHALNGIQKSVCNRM